MARLFLRTTQVSDAQDALTGGNFAGADRLALGALERAKRVGDFDVQARACLVLANTAVAASKMRRAYVLSSRALELFQHESQAAGQADALTISSYAASTLGMDDVAVRAAGESIALRDQIPSGVSHALGYKYLGIASSWAKDFETASGTLEAAAWFAEEELDATSASFHPLVTFCFSEVLRCVDIERQGGRADISRLQQLLGAAWARSAWRPTATLSIGIPGIAQVLLDFSSCFSFSRAGRPAEAFRHYLSCVERADSFPRNSWVQAVVCWARLEMARMHGDLPLCLDSADAMQNFAARGEHVHLQRLAQDLKLLVKAQASE